jgi:hypothetical protein
LPPEPSLFPPQRFRIPRAIRSLVDAALARDDVDGVEHDGDPDDTVASSGFAAAELEASDDGLRAAASRAFEAAQRQRQIAMRRRTIKPASLVANAGAKRA